MIEEIINVEFLLYTILYMYIGNYEIYEKLYANSSFKVYLDKDQQKAVEIISLIIETLLQS